MAGHGKVAAGLGLAVLAAQGCTAPPAARPNAQAEPAILVDGAAVSRRDLEAALGEVAGGVVIEETVLGLLLEAERRRRDLQITAADIDRERLDLLEAIQAGASGDSGLLLARVRAERGLGPERFAALLRRNAVLRALVAPDITVGPDEVRLAHQIRTGPTVRARLIIAPTSQEAADARAALLDAAPGAERIAAAAGLARRVSLHPSAPAGGLIAALSPADPAYPAALREAAERTGVGEVSPLVPVDGRWGVLVVEERSPGQGGELDPSTSAAIEQELRRRKERLEMERLARRLTAGAEVLVLDPSLGWSYRQRQGGSR